MQRLRRLIGFLFGFKGRIGRRAFLASSIMAVAVGLQVLESFPSSPPNAGDAERAGRIIVLAAVIAVPLWVVLALAAKRHRSAGLPGWTGPLAVTLLLGSSSAVNNTFGPLSAVSGVMAWLQLAWFALACLWPPRRPVEDPAGVF